MRFLLMSVVCVSLIGNVGCGSSAVEPEFKAPTLEPVKKEDAPKNVPKGAMPVEPL